AVADLLDDVLAEPLLARSGEARVLADDAVDDARVADPRDLLRRLVDDAVAPERAVEAQEGLQRLGLVAERALGDRVASDRLRGRLQAGLAHASSGSISSMRQKRPKPSKIASASTSATVPGSPSACTTGRACSSVIPFASRTNCSAKRRQACSVAPKAGLRHQWSSSAIFASVSPAARASG